MSVRLKVWIAMGALILWMSAAFFGISRVYLESQFQEYTAASQKQQAAHWAQYLTDYYQDHHNWKGVGQDILAYSNHLAQQGHNLTLERMVISTPSGHTIVQVNIPSSDTAQPLTDADNALPPLGSDDGPLTGAIQIPIRLNGRTVAKATIVDREIAGQQVLEQEALHSTMVATVLGLLLTAGISLVAAAVLARRVTAPLQVMMGFVRRIREGDLSARVDVRSHDEFARLASAMNEMSQDLDASIQARRHLIADVAHELRTPVTIIQGQLDLLQDGLVPTEPASLLPLQDEVLRLRTLIDELQQLALAESRQLVLHLERLELVGWMRQLLDKFRPEAAEKRLHLTLRAEVPAVWVNADSQRLTQVFANLVGNAIRYTPSNGIVTVEVTRDSGTGGAGSAADTVRSNDEPSATHAAESERPVVVHVHDTGPGIEPDKLDRIFDRFYRTEEARSRESGGLGLGLAIAKELLEIHGGTISATSTLGVGTTFTVWLPEAVDDSETS
ncbi:MAG: HAMP domain-containing protein [Alicyclobacillus sp.]|nr:HAMP domain-containing protein [Alicyclobacillus sp.]